MGRFFDIFNLFGPRPTGRVTSDEVLSSRKLRASIVDMFAAGMDTDEIGKRLVIAEHIVLRALHSEREKQRTAA